MANAQQLRPIFLGVVTVAVLGAILVWRMDRSFPGDPVIPAAFLSRLDQPIGIIFDTDIGNDIDDALAMGLLHNLQSRRECELLAVTISKDNRWCAPFCDLVNTFYGRGDIPIGVVRNGKTPQDSRYLRAVVELQDDSRECYPHLVRDGESAEDAVALQRRILAAQPDHSVVFVVVGFSSNIARLIESPPDSESPLAGRELVGQKCRFLSMMAGSFTRLGRRTEFNVVQDVDSARSVFANWPTPIVASGYEVGSSVKMTARSIERDYRYVAHHPLRDAYLRYRPMPYDQETWDLTSVLFAVRPDRGYFGIRGPGTIGLDNHNVTQFSDDVSGKHYYLTIDSREAVRVRETMEHLVSEPPQL